MIALRSLAVRAGEFALRDIDLEVPAGSYGVLMGATGSGKTTLLECLLGLREAQGGSIWIGGHDVTRARPGERGVGYVPQDGALFPTMTVREHLAFGPRLRQMPRAEIQQRVEELAEQLKIGPLLERRPQGLSGGERQRVALGRALSWSPEALCLDEPLSSLDEETWEEMVGLLREVQKSTGLTALHVTHRREEALRLADCRFILRAGRVEPGPSPNDPSCDPTGS